MSLSRVAWSLRSSARFFALALVLPTLLLVGCSDDDDDEDEEGGDSSYSMEQRVLVDVGVKVHPTIPLLNGEEEDSMLRDGRPGAAPQGDAEDDDVLAAVAGGAPVDVKSGASGGGGASDAEDDDE
jgi:hypothetical protein